MRWSWNSPASPGCILRARLRTAASPGRVAGARGGLSTAGPSSDPAEALSVQGKQLRSPRPAAPPGSPAEPVPSPPACPGQGHQVTIAQTQQEGTPAGKPRCLCSLKCLGTELCLLQPSRLQEAGEDRRSSTKTGTCSKKEKEGRGRFRRDVTCQFAVQVPAGGTPECAAFLLAWCCSPEEPSASSLLPPAGNPRWL